MIPEQTKKLAKKLVKKDMKKVATSLLAEKKLGKKLGKKAIRKEEKRKLLAQKVITVDTLFMKLNDGGNNLGTFNAHNTDTELYKILFDDGQTEDCDPAKTLRYYSQYQAHELAKKLTETGITVRKIYDGISYEGEVYKYNVEEKWVRIKYADNDEEESTFAEMENYSIRKDAVFDKIVHRTRTNTGELIWVFQYV